MNKSANIYHSETPFKHNEPEGSHHNAAADDFDNVNAQPRNLLPIGKALVFDDLYRSRIMFIGDISIPNEGKPVYHLYADPETLRKNGITDYFLDTALSMAIDIFRTPPEKQTCGFYIAPAHLDKNETIAREEYRTVESIYLKCQEKHAARAQREAAYSCSRCKRQEYKRHPDDHELLFYCGVPDDREVHPENPRLCAYFWFDRWYGDPENVC